MWTSRGQLEFKGTKVPRETREIKAQQPTFIAIPVQEVIATVEIIAKGDGLCPTFWIFLMLISVVHRKGKSRGIKSGLKTQMIPGERGLI